MLHPWSKQHNQVLLHYLEWGREHRQTGQACSLETLKLYVRCALSSENLDDPSTDWERWRALIATPVGDRAIRLSLTCESCWYETPSICTVDMSNTCVTELPKNVLLCPECPSVCVRVFTSERARQAHRTRAYGHRTMARYFVIDERCPACGKIFGSRPMAIEHLNSAVRNDVGA